MWTECRIRQVCVCHVPICCSHKVLSVSWVTAWSGGSGRSEIWGGGGILGMCIIIWPGFLSPSLQLSSPSDESLSLLYLSHSDEVELMATFTPADVINAAPGEQESGSGRLPAGSFCCPPVHAHTCINDLHQPACFILTFGWGNSQVSTLQGSA